MREEYDEIMERVTAVALAHDQLTLGGAGQTHVSAMTYIEAVCSGLERTVEGELRIERDAEPIELRADRIVPVGLILNELLTNAIKYAVKGRGDAMIKVRLHARNEHAEATLQVSDDGPGMGDARSGSLGLQLIETFVTQLSGRMNIDSSSKGTTVTVHFPLVE
jgi:two-component sensor histidine kinase